MKTYKAWIHVEEYDEDEDTYQDLDLPACVAEFTTQDEAFDYVNAINLISQTCQQLLLHIK